MLYLQFYPISYVDYRIAPNVMDTTNFGDLQTRLLVCPIMFGLEALMVLIQQVSGTPYVIGGDSPAGTDCSGLASWVSNVASGRPAFGSRFHTSNEESALLARGFQYGTAPGALVVGWNSHHTAVTLPDGTPVSSGEGGGGVRVGGGGAYQPQFTHHMFLPLDAAPIGEEPAPMPVPVGFDDAGPPPEPGPEPGPPPVQLVAAPWQPPPADAAPPEPAEPGEPGEPAPAEQEPAPAPV